MNIISLRNCNTTWVVFTLFFDSYLEKPSQVVDPHSLILKDFQYWRWRVQSSFSSFHFYISIYLVSCLLTFSYIELFIVVSMVSTGSSFAPLWILSWRTIIFPFWAGIDPTLLRGSISSGIKTYKDQPSMEMFIMIKREVLEKWVWKPFLKQGISSSSLSFLLGWSVVSPYTSFSCVFFQVSSINQVIYPSSSLGFVEFFSLFRKWVWCWCLVNLVSYSLVLSLCSYFLLKFSRV